MTNDTKNISNVVPTHPVHPIENTAPDTPNHLITRETKNQGGGFFEAPTNKPPEVQQPLRDTKGRFLSGFKGPGRPKGARSKISEVLLRTLADDFIEHGADALAKLRQNDTECYFRIIAQLVPKQLLMKQEEQPDIDYASLTPEEAAQLLDEIRYRKMIEKAIESVSK